MICMLYDFYLCAFYFEPLGSEIESSKKDTVLFIASDDIILVPILFFNRIVATEWCFPSLIFK